MNVESEGQTMTLLLTMFLCLWIVNPAFAQMSTFQDTQGTMGMVVPNGNNQGMFFDNQGRQGQYQKNGSMGQWSDNQGTQGQWQDVGPRQRAFSDNQGGHGQTFDHGNGLGSFNYGSRNGSGRQGQSQQFGR